MSWDKAVLTLAGVLIGVPVSIIGALVFYFYAGIWWDNANYAKRVFSGLVPYEQVVGSQRWFNTGIGCSYAIVELSKDATTHPPAPRNRESGKRHDPFEDFGGDWQPTPGPDFGDPNVDGPWIYCELALGQETYEKLRNAMITPGGWWIGDGDTIQVYSSPTSVAYRVYQGD